MSTKEASKFISLERLYQIKRDHYLGQNGVDYDGESINALIIKKESRKSFKANEALSKQWDQVDSEKLTILEEIKRTKLLIPLLDIFEQQVIINDLRPRVMALANFF